MLQLGEVIDGRYRTVRKIGQGGQSVVFEAEDLENNAHVALKVLQREESNRPELEERMNREARVMGMLAGTAAVRIHSFGRTSSGQMYIAMELLRGMDLEQRILQFEEQYGSIPAHTVIGLLSPIVDTLEVAHARGIVHRDIKPANIFVLENADEGRVRLLDFGMVKDLFATTQLTVQGVVVGSPYYIAPEGWHGNSSVVTQTADVYSLGAVIYRMLSGSVPFHGDSLLDMVRLVIRGPRPSLHAERLDLPRGIDRWVERALSIEPTNRFASVREMWTELTDILGMTPST